VSKRDSSVIVYAEAKSRVIDDDGGIQRYVTVSSDEIEMRMTRTVKLVQNIEGGSATIKYSNGNIWNGENVGVGETLTLTATPKPGYKFEYWTDGYDNHIISYNNTFSLRIMDGHYDSLYPVFSTVEFWVSHFANSANGERTNCDKVNAYASCTADRDYIFGRDSLNLNARFKATSTLQFASKVNMFLFAQIDDNESSRVGIHEMLASDLANKGYSYTKDWKFGEKHAELMESVKSTLTYKVGYVSAGKTDTAWSSPITFTKKYPVTFVDADGKVLQDGAYYYNDETVTAPQAPEKDGWEFCGVYANKTWNEGDPEIGVAYGYAASSDEALGVIVDGKKGGEGLHTTSIGKHNTRASEFRMNFVPSIYDLKGRKVGNGRKAKGVYLNK
jgi:hypothetical protein